MSIFLRCFVYGPRRQPPPHQLLLEDRVNVTITPTLRSPPQVNTYDLVLFMWVFETDVRDMWKHLAVRCKLSLSNWAMT